MGGVYRLGAGMPSTHAQVHIALRTSLKIHVQLNASLNKRKPQSAAWEPMEKAGSGRVATVTSLVPLPPQLPCRDYGFLIRNIFPPP